MRELLRDLDFPVLGSLATSGDLDALTEQAMADFFITRSPSPWSESEVRAASQEALAVSRR